MGMADDLRLDEGVGREVAVVGVLEELVGGEEVRREPPAQAGGVDYPGKE